jgi:hypothetical protein
MTKKKKTFLIPEGTRPDFWDYLFVTTSIEVLAYALVLALLA